jgi:hypothetical protein
MKRRVVIIGLFFLLMACNSSIDKPKNLIDKDKMIHILYDISLLEAIKTQNIEGGISSKNANEYIYKKYKIDSIQLLESNRYYASDMEEYKKMFEKIKERLDEATKKNGGVATDQSTATNSDVPQVQ